MVIADGTWVGVFDPKSNRNPTRYPLAKTPLSLLLRDRLSLAEPGLVLGATRDADGTDITVVDPRAPQEGRMRMRFDDAPDPAASVGDHHQGRPADPRRADRAPPPASRSTRSLFNIELAATCFRDRQAVDRV